MFKKYIKILFFILVILSLILGIFIFAKQINKNKLTTNYILWADKKIQENKKDVQSKKIIGYVGDEPIYLNELLVESLISRIRLDYFSETNLLENDLEQASIYDGFNNILKYKYLIQYAKQLGIKYDIKDAVNLQSVILNTESKSSSVTIRAIAKVKQKYSSYFTLSTIGFYVDKLLQEKFLNKDLDEKENLQRYKKMYEDIQKNFSVIILKDAPEEIRTSEFIKKLKDQGIDIDME